MCRAHVLLLLALLCESSWARTAHVDTNPGGLSVARDGTCKEHCTGSNENIRTAEGVSVAEAEDFFSIFHLLYLPRNMGDAADLVQKLEAFTATHYHRFLAMMLFIFVLLQACSIPGTIFLNVMMGGLLGYKEGLALGICSGTIGASIAYTVSKNYGKTLAARLVKLMRSEEKLEMFKDQVHERRHDLFFFLLFLRISPVLPNWFINVVSPHVGVPLSPLIPATIVGIAPQTFLAVHAGVVLRGMLQATNTSPIGVREWFGLLGTGLLALLPVLLKKKGKAEGGRRACSVCRKDD